MAAPEEEFVELVLVDLTPKNIAKQGPLKVVDKQGVEKAT